MNNSKLIGYRPTWAEVNLSNLGYNFKQVKKRLAPGVQILITVKADAYGHGLIPVAKKLAVCGADYFGVASIDEGIVLRQNNIKLPILVMGMILKEDIAPILKYNLTPTVCTKELALALNNRGKIGKIIPVHIKVDTGMARLGVTYKDALRFILQTKKLSFLNIEGLFTHFAFADMNKEFTAYQVKLLDKLARELSRQGVFIPLIHAANSMGVIDYSKGHFNMVRPGLIIYGLYPKQGLKLKLKPALTLKTKVVYFKQVAKGQGISYGHTYITKKNTTVVTLPIGYGDGYPRNLSNLAPVLIGGKRFKISGRVCMDQIMVDVGSLPVRIGDEAVLIGAQGKQKISAEELAKLAGTIPYEIVCGLGSRVPRVNIA